MSTAAHALPQARVAPGRTVTGAHAVTWSRIAAATALAAFAELHWALLTLPASRGAGLAGAGLAGALGALAHATRDLGRARRAGLLVGAALVALVVALLCAGVPLRLFAPAHLGKLFSGIGSGLSSLPDARYPYRGLEEWVRRLIPVGGFLLVAAGVVWAAVRPAGVRPALVLLLIAYAVPAAELNPLYPFLDGAVLAVLVGALVFADALPRHQRGLATWLSLGVVAAGAALGAAVDARRPWIDPEHLGDHLHKAPVVFDWNHGYGPLHWGRAGRVLLTVRANYPAYWKATTLDAFDGRRWLHSPGGIAVEQADADLPAPNPEWMEDVTFIDRGLRSRQYVGAGDVRSVSSAPTLTAPDTGQTFVSAARPLGPGDTWIAHVYTPRPTAGQLRHAGLQYPPVAQNYLTMGLPGSGPDKIVFAPWGDPRGTRYLREGAIVTGGENLLAHSVYAPFARIAARLRARSATPYAYLRAVVRTVQTGARYTEDPPPARYPLVDFLTGHRRGYCQQYSGTTALLLRMGGVPARVASGFTSGISDGGNEYTVADLDAHSWVEAYFPKYGWITVDPTPQIAPPRLQIAANVSPFFAPRDRTDTGASQDRSRTARPDAVGGSRAHAAGTGLAWLIAALVVLAGSVVLLVVRAVRRERARSAGVPPELVELHRALRRTGRAAEPLTTLHRLEGVLDGNPDALAYLRGLRLARFGRGGVAAPTAAERRGLRRELGAGLGLAGRVRGWWALPPRAPGRRSQRVSP